MTGLKAMQASSEKHKCDDAKHAKQAGKAGHDKRKERREMDKREG